MEPFESHMVEHKKGKTVPPNLTVNCDLVTLYARLYHWKAVVGLLPLKMVLKVLSWEANNRFSVKTSER